MGLTDGGRRLRHALLFLLAAAAMAPAWGRTVLELDPARQPIELLDWGDAWIDESGQALADGVATDARINWTPTRQGAIYPLTTGKALWVRFTVPPAPDAERWYLEIPYPSVNLVTLYTPDSAGRWTAQAAGDTLPVADWPVPHRHPLLPRAGVGRGAAQVPAASREPAQLQRAADVRERKLPEPPRAAHLADPGHLLRPGRAWPSRLGVLSALSLRDSAYGFYALSVALMGLAQAALTGIGGLHLWPALAVVERRVVAWRCRCWPWARCCGSSRPSCLAARALAQAAPAAHRPGPAVACRVAAGIAAGRALDCAFA